MPELRIQIPADLDFSALRLARDAYGMVSFSWLPIERICAESGIDVAIFRDAPEDNLAALVNAWYAEHIARGGKRDPVQEDFIAETLLEDERGGGFSYPPGAA